MEILLLILLIGFLGLSLIGLAWWRSGSLSPDQPPANVQELTARPDNSIQPALATPTSIVNLPTVTPFVGQWGI